MDEMCCPREKIQNELACLRRQIAEKENELADLNRVQADEYRTIEKPLMNEEISRYSRQMILPDFGGVQAQVKLKNTSFLIVGMGGLGCPAAQYLAAAGAGTIGIVDYDEVEGSNLHRQILHMEDDIDVPKADSAKSTLQKLNSFVKIVSYTQHFGNEIATELVEQYDVILDCSDNVPTRYLLNDVCVMKGKPLISGSALQYDGQLTVYNFEGGPCYRCLFPVPPPPETVTNCGDGGVLGPITGAIGSLQALEAIKLSLGLGEILAGRMLLFDGLRCSFRSIRLRAKRKECNVCSDTPFVTRLINYEDFCGLRSSDKDFSLSLLHDSLRIHVRDYVKMMKYPHLLLDVRTPVEFEMCRLDNSVNIPLKAILDDSRISEIREKMADKKPLIILCRRGNDSQIAVQHLTKKLPPDVKVRDIRGGLFAWHNCIDPDFPIY